MTRPIRLVIFDCDGVLVDSEVLAVRTLVAAMAAEGIDVSFDYALATFLGRSLASISEALMTSHGRPLAPSVLEAMRGDLYTLYRAELQPTPGIAEALAALDIPFCVASSSQLERIGISLEVTGLAPAFGPHVFSASMVSRGKPAPDLFLHAAKAMGVDPADCLVIEDSPAGIEAARAAGMRVFAFLGGSHVGPAGLAEAAAALGPDARLTDIRALVPLITRLNRQAAGEPSPLVAAVDVGTASARAALVDAQGGMLARAEHLIDIRRDNRTRAEHRSEQIWSAVSTALREAMDRARVDPDEIRGLAFDATCSLVVRDRSGAPLAVSPETGEADWDTIVWLDHRAGAEADACTATGDPALDNLGGIMFPEMQIPKIMWLKRHLGDRWGEVGSLFDLADFLAWRATGSTTRSLCTLAAKWSYNPAAPDPWPVAMLETCGVPDLPERAGIKAPPVPVGTPIGTLTGAAARDLGLNPGTPVAAGMVDAFAGALGALGADVALPEGTGRATAIVAGTSTAVLCMAREAVQLSGIWGPFHGAIIPGIAVVEGGQSAAGALLDHIIRNHAAGGEPTAERHQSIGRRISELLALEGPDLGGRLHVVPDFLGNRSPLGDPRAMGILWGLTLESDFDSLCRLYWRAAVGLALSLRQILTHLGQIGFLPDLVPIVGGHTRSPVLLQLYADAIGRKVRGPGVQDATLLGTAMAAATGAGLFPTLAAAAGAMHHLGPIKTPRPDYERRFIRDYAAFLALQAHRAEVEDLLPAQ